MINSYEYIYKWSCVRNKFVCRQGNKDGFLNQMKTLQGKKSYLCRYVPFKKKNINIKFNIKELTTQDKFIQEIYTM